MPRNTRERLADILEACERISRYTAGHTEASFKVQEMVVDAVLRNLILIGEAATRIPELDRNPYDSIAWAEMIGMRNIVVHDYFGVDAGIIWQTAAEDVPKLAEEIQKIISS